MGVFVVPRLENGHPYRAGSIFFGLGEIGIIFLCERLASLLHASSTACLQAQSAQGAFKHFPGHHRLD